MKLTWRKEAHEDGDWDLLEITPGGNRLLAWVTTGEDPNRRGPLQYRHAVAINASRTYDPYGPFNSLEEAKAFAVAVVTLGANSKPS